MLTRPSYFTKFHQHVDGDRVWIVKITDGSTTWLCGETDMALTEGHVYPLLKSAVEFDKFVDPFNHSFTLSEMEITFINAPYTKDNKRLSDADLLSATELTVYVYACAGPTAAALTDCMLVFEGKVIGEPTYDATTLTLRVADISAMIEDINLPLSLLDDADSGHPFGDKRLPIVLGDMTGANDFGDGNQLVRGYGRNDSGDLVFLLADHELHDVGDLWLYMDAVGGWLKLDMTAMSATVGTETGDDGILRTKVTIGADELLKGWLYLPPTGVAISPDILGGLGTGYKDGRNNLIEGQKAWDRDQGSYAELHPCASKTHGMVSFYWPDYDILRAKPTVLDLELGALPQGRGRTHLTVPPLEGYADLTAWTIDEDDAYLLWKISRNTAQTLVGSSWSFPDPDTYLYVEGGVGAWVYNNPADIFSGTLKTLQLSDVTYQFDSEVGWKMTTNDFFASFLVKVSADALAWMLRIYEVSLRLYVTTDQYLNVDSPLYAECEGLTIGSTIATRLGGGAGATDQARAAGHQAERLLRLYFGFDDSHVDGTRIDASQVTSLYTRGIIDESESESLGNILQRLSDDSNVIAYINELSKLSVVNMIGAVGTATVIPYFDLLDPPRVFRTDQRKLCNYLKMSYGYDQSNHSFATTTPIQNAASQTTNGIIERAVRCQMLDPASVNVYSIMTMTGSETVTPFLPTRHAGIVIRVGGWKYLHLEIGDWIELDPTTTNPHVLFNGATWNDEQFIIIGKKVIGKSAVELTAMQLS